MVASNFQEDLSTVEDVLPIAFDEVVLDINKIYVACECRCTSSHRVLQCGKEQEEGIGVSFSCSIGLGSNSRSPSWSSTKSILPKEILMPGVKVSTSLLMKPI